MEEKKIALWVLGIIVLISIIGLVLIFKAEKTGQTIGAGVYVYPKSPFPYTRHMDKVVEKPSTYGVQTRQEIPDYGGASQTFGGAERAVSQGFVYNRDPEKKIYQVLTSCAGQANIGRIPPGYTRSASVQLAQTIGIHNCVKAPDQVSNFAYCCKEPGLTVR